MTNYVTSGTFVETGAAVVFEDARVTEYADGTEAVRFTEEEWAIMLADPAFGYVCRSGRHRVDSPAFQEWAIREGGCMTCSAEMEAAYSEEAGE